MEAPASINGKRCSWCGNVNSATDKTCSKCGAALSANQQPAVSSPAQPESLSPVIAEENQAFYQDRINALVDTSLYDKLSSEAMRGAGIRTSFESGQTRAFAAAGCLTLYILVNLVGAGLEVSRVAFSSAATGRPRVTPAEVPAIDVLTLLVRLSLTVIVLVTAIFFLAWIYRAYKNLKALGATDLKFSPGWAIGGFFIPILNIVRPFQIVAEIWKASGVKRTSSVGTGWSDEGTPAFIAAWWGSWLISGFLQSFGVLMVLGAGKADQLSVASRVTLVSDVISITCAALAITVVLKINARQEAANRLYSSIEVQPDGN